MNSSPFRVKISYGQLLIVLLLCRIFTIMTYVPLIGKGYSLTTQLIATMISTAIQAVAVIPIIYLIRVSPSESVTSSAFSISRGLGILYSVLYFVYFIVYGANSVLRFQRFITVRFYPKANRYLWLAVFIIVCVYCAYLGIEGLARSSVIILVLFVAMVILMILMSGRDIDINNYCLETTYKKSLWSAVMEDLSRNGEIVALAFLMKYIKDRLRCCAYGYLAAKLVTIEAITLLIITVLGDFAELTEYPFMEVGSYAGVRLIQRLDSVYMVIWTITAVISISLFILIGGDIINELIPEMKLTNSLCGLIIFLLCLPFVVTSEVSTGIMSFMYSGYSIVIFTAILPLIVLIVRKVQNSKKEKGI